MFATIYLPDFYLQAVLRHQPELRDKPVALIDDQEKKGGDCSAQHRGGKKRCAIRNDAEPGLSAVPSVGNKNAPAFAGKAASGNPASLCRHARTICRGNRPWYFDCPIYGWKESNAEDYARDRTISGH